MKTLVANTELLRTIEDEFDEMPGMRLTEAQFRRLWALQPTECHNVTAALVNSGILTIDAGGRFCRRADLGDQWATRSRLEDEISEAQTRGQTRRIAYPLFATGEPAREILACADRVSADLIVMGTHGRSQIGRFVLGSVTHEVLEHTIRPVLVTHRD